jgi:hypothetical protein
MKLPFTFLILFIFFFCSCRKSQTPPDVIPEEQFTNFYADLLILREKDDLLGSDSLTSQHRMDSLYQKYQIDSGKVQTTIETYKQDLNRWKEFHKKVTNRLQIIQREELSKPKL